MIQEAAFQSTLVPPTMPGLPYPIAPQGIAQIQTSRAKGDDECTSALDHPVTSSNTLHQLSLARKGVSPPDDDQRPRVVLPPALHSSLATRESWERLSNRLLASEVSSPNPGHGVNDAHSDPGW